MLLVIKLEGRSLLQGSFALSRYEVFQQILEMWRGQLTRIAQREHAGQIVRGMQFSFSRVAFMTAWG